jgi:hypothetical protein
MKRLMRLASWLYPSSWRRRYAREFKALLDDVKPGPLQLFDVLKGAIAMQVRIEWSDIMRIGFRIVMWASAGFLISAGWGFYFAVADKSVPIGPIVYALTRLTVPAAAVLIHYPLGLRAVEIMNAATYALLGLIMETIRRRSQIPDISKLSLPDRGGHNEN